MSAYPLMIEGASLTAVVIGGGEVGTRKALALLDAGALVSVVAPVLSDALLHESSTNERLGVRRARYAATDIGSATLVVAATNDSAANAKIAADARAAGRLVTVASAPELGNCSMPAIHRSGDLVVAVSAGGVPTAAARIRDALGRVFDGRYADAVRELALLRRTMIDRGDRQGWAKASTSLTGVKFCTEVEAGAFDARLAEWR